MIRTLTCRLVVATLMDYVDGTLAEFYTCCGVEDHLRPAPCAATSTVPTARRLAWCGGRPARGARSRACGSSARGRSSVRRLDRDDKALAGNVVPTW